MSAAGEDKSKANPNNIVLTVKGTRLYVPLVSLAGKDNQKPSKLLSKGFERSIHWNEYKTKSENKNTANK